MNPWTRRQSALVMFRGTYTPLTVSPRKDEHSYFSGAMSVGIAYRV
jgi:hypothetical protein